MLYAKKAAQFVFELAHVRPVVAEPTPVPHVIDALDESLPIAHTWAADVKWLGKSRGTTQNGQIGYFGFCAVTHRKSVAERGERGKWKSRPGVNQEAKVVL